MRSIAVINQKGGCGKTTTAINLAAALAELQQRALLVDMDPQGHCALGLAVPESQLAVTISDALLADPASFDLDDAIWQISDRLSLLPATVSLATVEQRLAGSAQRDLRLKRLLESAAGRFDVCIIDCPPNIGLLTFNALRASSEVIIPVEAGYFALAGAVKQASTVQLLADRVGHRIALHVLPTMYDVRTRMARQIVSELRKHFGPRCLRVPIHLSAKLREAASYGQPVCEYDPSSRGTQDFARLAQYLLEHAPDEEPAAPMREAAPVADRPQEPGRFADRLGAALEPVATSHRFDPPSFVGSERDVEQEMMSGASSATAVIEAPVNSRAAELVQRARALAERTAQLQQRLAADPDIARIEAQERRAVAGPHEPRSRKSLAEKLRDFYGVRVTGQGTLFVQPRGVAQSVAVAGDFNNWSPVATPLSEDRRLGCWQACVQLPPGRYRYRLIVDGRWVADPHNQRVEMNAYGEMNNVVEVQ